MSRRVGPIVGASAWLAGLAGLGWWLVRLGQGGGGLANPPVADPSTWAAWAEGVGPITAAFALLRLACLAAVVYLIVALLVGVAARLTGRRTLVRLSDAISIGLVRRILNGAVGVGVTTGALAAGSLPLVHATVGALAGGPGHQLTLAMPAGSELVDAADSARIGPLMRAAEPTSGGSPTGPSMRPAGSLTPTDGTGPVMRAAEPTNGGSPTGPSMRPADSGPVMRATDPAPLEDAGPRMQPIDPSGPAALGAEPPSMPATTEAPAPPPTMRVEDDAGPGPTTPATSTWTSDTEPIGAPAPVPPTITPAPDPSAPASRVVLRPGDHLWAVAERHLDTHLGREADEGEITAYWRRLIALNVDQLADPTNPDLVFTGQVIELPPT